MVRTGTAIPVRFEFKESCAGNKAERREDILRRIVEKILSEAPARDVHGLRVRIEELDEVTGDNEVVGAQPFVDAQSCAGAGFADTGVRSTWRGSGELPNRADAGDREACDLRAELHGINHRAV